MDILFNNNRPFIEGVSVDEITKSFSTPLYIYSQKKIEKAYNNLGNTCKELGEFNEASDFYQKSINIEPNNANAHYNLGNSNQQLQKFDKALDLNSKNKLTSDLLNNS